MARTRRITRSEAVELIKEQGYRFYTVTWITRAGNEMTINCSSRKDCVTRLGYIRAQIPRQGWKSVDPRTMSKLIIGGQTYRVV